jgi:uncharacterized protein YkwD
MARGRRGKRRKSAHEHRSDRQPRRRLLPLAAGLTAVPVGMVLAGALLVADPADRLNPFATASDGSVVPAQAGEAAADDAVRVPDADDGSDFFAEPTGTPRESVRATDGPVAAEVTATAAPEEEETEDAADDGRGESGGSGSGSGSGNGSGGSGGSGGGDDTVAAASSEAGRVVQLVNTARASEGCGSLRVDDRLTAAAQEHSEDMHARDYMSHESPEGEGPGERAARHGYDAWGAENVAKGQENAQQVMDAWMNSPGHRANILNCDLVAIGVGESGNAWTQLFGRE